MPATISPTTKHSKEDNTYGELNVNYSFSRENYDLSLCSINRANSLTTIRGNAKNASIVNPPPYWRSLKFPNEVIEIVIYPIKKQSTQTAKLFSQIVSSLPNKKLRTQEEEKILYAACLIEDSIQHFYDISGELTEDDSVLFTLIKNSKKIFLEYYYNEGDEEYSILSAVIDDQKQPTYTGKFNEILQRFVEMYIEFLAPQLPYDYDIDLF